LKVFGTWAGACGWRRRNTLAGGSPAAEDVIQQWHGIDPTYAISGLIVGILVGLTGTGGGSLMTPLLMFFGIPTFNAIGTDQLYNAITKVVGTLVHGFKGTVDWLLVGRLAAGSVPAAAATLLLLHYLHDRQEAQAVLVHVIKYTLGVAVLITAVTVMFRSWILARFALERPEQGRERSPWLTVALGAGLAVVVTLSSVGAGAIGVTALLLLHPAMPMGRLIGSDIAHAVPLALIASIGYGLNGNIDWPLLASLLCGSLPGIIVGSLVATRVPDRVIRPLLASILFAIGINLFVRHDEARGVAHPGSITAPGPAQAPLGAGHPGE
jgi:uncharacterized membrane protein YfcA